MATATPPTPGETTDTPELQPAPAVTPAPANAVVVEPGPADTAVARPADPDDAVETVKTPTLVDRVQAFRSKHEMAEIATFFFLGFAYDILTLNRIDDTFTIVQQALYLGVLTVLLLLNERYGEGSGAEPPRWLAKVWRFREDALHFFYGSLMSSYTLFFFKSASGFLGFIFLVVMLGLMVANELPRFRALGPVVRVALFSLCVTSYFAYVLPVLLGRIGWPVFLAASVLGAACIFGLMHAIRRWNPDPKALTRHFALPGFGVPGLLFLLYVVGVLPPIPLAVQYSGIYHDVKPKPSGNSRRYHLSHERTWWRFWHHGDQHFLARPGEKAYYFFRIFAPSGFHAFNVRVRWYYDSPEKGWAEVGKGTLLPVISNGTDRGFRSFAYASNPKPGDWVAVLETEDGHEINRLHFTVEADTRTEPRQFSVDEDSPNSAKPEQLSEQEKAAQAKAESDKAKAESDKAKPAPVPSAPAPAGAPAPASAPAAAPAEPH